MLFLAIVGYVLILVVLMFARNNGYDYKSPVIFSMLLLVLHLVFAQVTISLVNLFVVRIITVMVMDKL